MNKNEAIEVLIQHAKRCPEPEPRVHGYPEDVRDYYNEWRERVGRVDAAVKVLSGLEPWIKSADRLPEYDIVCWVVIAATRSVEVRRFNSHWKCWDDESGDDFMNKIDAVSHWYPYVKPTVPRGNA